MTKKVGKKIAAAAAVKPGVQQLTARALLKSRALLTLPETASILGVSVRKVWLLTKLRKNHPNHIPTVVLGEKTFRVSSSFLRRLVGEME